MPFQREDRKISFIGGLILLAITLVAGLSVFLMMQRQTEVILGNSLQASLQGRERLFVSQLERALSDVKTVATRPLLIQNLRALESQSGPAREQAQANLERAVSSFLQTGFAGLSFYDARGQLVASAGTFSEQPVMRAPIKGHARTWLVWQDKFHLRSSMDFIDQQGQRAGTVEAEISLPQLTAVFLDMVSLGNSGEFGLCFPVPDDAQNMDCFIRAIGGNLFKRYPRAINGVPLPMDYALNGKTGLIHAKDYRQEAVIAAHAPGGSLGFGMVLKIDASELYQPITTQVKLIAPLMLGLVLLGMLLLGFLVAPLVRKLVQSEQAARDVSIKLQNSEAQLREITDAIPARIGYVDAQQRIRFHNKAYEALIHYSDITPDGKAMREVMGEKLYEMARPRIEEVLRGTPVVYERTETTANGEVRDFAVNYYPRWGEGESAGKVIGFYSLITDITELKRVDRMKSEFVSTVSHELRTPLTSIRGSLGLIAGGVAGELPDTVKSLVEIAKKNCERLIRLINDILDIEKLESGQMRLETQVSDVGALLEQARLATEGYGEERKVSLSLHCPEERLLVCVDSDRLTQVVTNLLSNAVKFSPAGDTVEIHVSRRGSDIRVEVRDHGPGIPDEFRERIFQKFSQADSTDSRQKGGTGLGLYISQVIVERLGGTIGFETEEGVGTTFYFELPEWHAL